MNSRSIAILAALVVIVIAAAAWIGLSREHSSADAQLLYPQAKSALDQVSSVRIYGAGDELKVELTKQDAGWTIAQRSNYPADSAKVRQLIVGVAEAKVLEEKTSNPSNYSTLGVEDVSAADAKSTRIEWAAGKSKVNLVAGKEAGSVNTRYVRRAGEQPSWLVKADLFTSTDPKEWLDKQLMDVSADRVQSAVVDAGGTNYSVTKSTRADANFKVDGLKKGQTLSSEGAANAVAMALANLTLDDVRPFAEYANKPATAKATFKTFDGLVITLTGFEEDEARWIHARAAFDPTVPAQFGMVTAQQPVGNEGNSTVKEPQPNREQEASQLDARINGWVYEVADYKYEAIFRPLKELLQR